MKQKITLVLAILCSLYSFGQVGTGFTLGGLRFTITTATTVQVYPEDDITETVIIPSSVAYNSAIYQVTRIGEGAFSNRTSLTSVTIPNSVTSIGDRAFQGCFGLTSITIPNSLTSIGNAVFKYCSVLTSVTIPTSVTSIGESAFQSCSRLTSITIPNSVTSIGESAFEECYGLTSITIPNSVTSIGTSVFSRCSGLTSVIIPNSVTSIGASAFLSCYGLTSITIPNSVTSIGEWAFNSCSGLTSVIIPNSVTSIGTSAFSYCSGLTSVTIPNSVTSIGESAFRECSGLTSIVIPNSVTTIGKSVFSLCKGLTSVTIPNAVTSIGDSAFQSCSGLTSITIPNSVTTCGDYAFYGCRSLTSVTISNSIKSIGNSVFKDCKSLTSVTIPNSVITIGESAFSGCSGLTSVSIPNSVTRIADSVFIDCTSLTSITFPNSVLSIGASVFRGCFSLNTVAIPKSVQTIGDNAFNDCISLTSITVNWTTLLNIYFGKNIFTDLDLSTIALFVPTGSEATYQSSLVWKDFSPIAAPVAGKIQIGQQFVVNGINYVVNKETVPYEVAVGSNKVLVGDAVFPPSVAYNGNSFIVTAIRNYAFQSCKGLTSVTIPNSVISIGKSAFAECSAMISIAIPNSVTSIGESAFQSCYGLKSVTIPNSVTSIGARAFQSCYGLKSVTIPNSVTSIASSAFKGCSGLTSVTIPNSVTTIKSSTFESCSSLTSIIIPSSVTSIESGVFKDCSGLVSITIPNSVTNIGNNAFYNCDAIKTVNVNWIAPLNIDESVFTAKEYYQSGGYYFEQDVLYTSSVQLNVPPGTEAAYKAADIWKTFGTILETVAIPTINAFLPTTAATGTTVTITGTNFIGATAVSFGGIAATSFTVVNDTTITAVVGTGASGNVSVTTPGGTATKAGFAINSISTIGLIAWYPFNGNTLDNSGNNHNGVNTGATLTSDRFGNANSAYNFSGSGQYITCPNIAALNGLATATFSLWVKVNGKNRWDNGTDVNNAMFFLSRERDIAAGYIGMYFSPNTQTFASGFRSGTGVGLGTTVKYPVPQPEWHHISFTLGGGFFKFYVDGELVGTTPFTAPLATSSGAINLGKLPVGGYEYYLNGVLDDVAIYGRTMDSTEIKALYDLNVYAAPTLTSFTPTTLATGATVTLIGTNFTGATAVSFGGTAATSFQVVNATTITAVVGSGASGNVSVTTPGGTVTKTGFIFIPAPTITSFLPTIASTGSTVTITGTNFTGATAVSFGGIAATSFTVVNDVTITAVVGSGASGNVSITTPGGTATKAGFAINSIPTNGLIAWYPFNGNTLDNSGNNHNGVNNGATLTTDRFGNADSAYNFSGSGQYITCPNIAAINGLATATFTLWVKVNGKNRWDNGTDVGNAMFMLSREGDYGAGYIGMYFSPNTQTFAGGFRSGTGVGLGTTVKYPVPQPEWHHLSFTLGGGFFKFYVDGLLVSSTPFTAPLATSSGTINLGKLPVSGYEYYLNGVLDDVAIYGRTMDSNEIEALYDLSGSLAVNKFDNKAFTYYPNPVDEELNLSYSYGLTAVKVFDNLGRQVYFKKLNEDSVKVDMSSMVRGVYFVEVTSKDSSKTIRVIKK